MYKIGIFDSGVGGLTVLKEIRKKLPDSHIIYYGDNANAPYGDKEKEDIKKLCLRIGRFLYKNKVDAIVIACNTATAASLDTLQEMFTIPVIGTIEPGVKAALKATRNNNIAVIATPASVKMNAYKNVFDILAPQGAFLTQNGCKLLCPMIEKGWGEIHGSYLTDEIIRLYLEAIPDEVDTLILGCTHYPLIKDNISKYFKKNIVDPAQETTEELLKRLIGIRTGRSETGNGRMEFIVSGKKEPFLNFAESFLEQKIENLYTLNLI